MYNRFHPTVTRNASRQMLEALAESYANMTDAQKAAAPVIRSVQS